METKTIWKSKTFWANIIALAIVLLTDFEQLLGSGADITILAVVNIIFRAVTKNGVTWK